MDRRSFLKFLLSTPLAATIDVEALIWVPKPIIVVPTMSNRGAIVAAAWEEYVGKAPLDEIFDHYWLLNQLDTNNRKPTTASVIVL